MKIKVRTLKDLTDPIILFAEDARDAEDLLDSDDSQQNRRNFVRALFAMIEGTIYFLKQTTFSTASSEGGLLTVQDALILQDSTVDLSSDGIPILKTKFLKLEDNLRYTTRVISKVYEKNIELEIGGASWQQFKSSIKIRNRITHPKSIKDFEINNKDLETMKKTRSWFCQLLADITSNIKEKITESNKASERSAEIAPLTQHPSS